MSRESATLALQSLTNEEADLLNNSPDLLAKFQQKHGLSQPQEQGTPLQQFGQDIANSNGFWGTTSTLLKAPEKMSSQGLKMISNSIPETVGGPMTGNRAMDVLRGTPKVAAETLAQVAPGFVSKGAILMSGALKGAQVAAPVLKMIGKGAASQLESLSGAKPGMAEAAYKAPMLNPLQLQAGKSAASPIYEAGKEIGGQINPELAQTAEKLPFIKQASSLADEGKLNPTEALEARKELDLIKKKVTGTFFRETKAKLDAIAKPVFAEADQAFKQGLLADSSRQIVPQNMHGGASAFKTGIMTGLQALKQTGGMGKVLGTVGQLAMSPAAVGAAATVAGDAAAVAKPIVNNPAAVVTLANLAKQATSQQLKDFIKSVRKENPDLSPQEENAAVRKLVKAQGLTIPKK